MGPEELCSLLSGSFNLPLVTAPQDQDPDLEGNAFVSVVLGIVTELQVCAHS
jgi:hypothetical protein